MHYPMMVLNQYLVEQKSMVLREHRGGNGSANEVRKITRMLLIYLIARCHHLH